MKCAKAGERNYGLGNKGRHVNKGRIYFKEIVYYRTERREYREGIWSKG